MNFLFVTSLYLLFLYLGVAYMIAYSVSYVIGMIFAWLVNSLYSFATRPRLSRLPPYAIVATINYLIGLLLVRWLVEGLMIPKALAPIIVIVALVPMSFAGTRLTLLAGLGRNRADDRRD